MYNADFLPQLEEFRKRLGLRTRNTIEESYDVPTKYLPLPELKTIKCHEDTNGEWVPNLSD